MPNGPFELVRSFNAALDRGDNLLAFIKCFTELLDQLIVGNLSSTLHPWCVSRERIVLSSTAANIDRAAALSVDRDYGHDAEHWDFMRPRIRRGSHMNDTNSPIFLQNHPG